MSEFKNKVILISGATGNLGLAVTEVFREADAKLVLVGRNFQNMLDKFPDLTEEPNILIVGGIDLTKEESVEILYEEVKNRFEHVDVIVNTVGGYKAGSPVHEMDVSTWDHMQTLNSKTVFLISRRFIPDMIERQYGRIINVAARPGLKGRKNMAAYSASKSGVIRLTESMSAELRNYGISVNCILPGTIDTPENRTAMPKADFSKWVDPVDIARVIKYLASEEAWLIQGAAIPVIGKS